MSLSSDPRASPFSVEEFSDLVCSAFSIHNPDLSLHLQQPLLAISPCSPNSACPSRDEGLSNSSYPHPDSDDHDAVPASPSGESLSPLPSPTAQRSRSRTITALRVFHQVRSRASAFVLKSRGSSPPRSNSSSPVPFEASRPSTASTQSPPPLSRALSPWSMVDLTRDSPRSRAGSFSRSFLPFARRDASPPPLPLRVGKLSSDYGSRSATPVLRSFFDDSPSQPKAKRVYSRPSTAPSVSYSASYSLSRVSTTSTSASAHSTIPTATLPSFFDDTSYQSSRAPISSFSRPATPTGLLQQSDKTRPQLRKSRSSGNGLLKRSKSRNAPQISDATQSSGLGFEDFALWESCQDKAMLTRPRIVPPEPDVKAAVFPADDFSADDYAPPPYVFERRGSSSTSNSTGSTRSTSSLSARLSNLVSLAFPGKARRNARSKLNLSIETASEEPPADSSPSTLSSVSSPSTPDSPVSELSRSHDRVYAASADGHHGSSGICDEDVLAIGRVLTPEADPFAKAEIALPAHGTPRPPTPPLSRRASSQASPAGHDRAATWSTGNSPSGMRTRNSLPSSPTSAAYTFPSSCSVYTEGSPGPDVHYAFPPTKPTNLTPQRRMPPSAWSPFSSPIASSAHGGRSPSSSPGPGRSPSSASLSPPRWQPKPKSPPSPSYSAFPLPPSTVLRTPFPPPALPPPTRALPAIPSQQTSPSPPPPPPKEWTYGVRAHKSLPPSPHSALSYSHSYSPPSALRPSMSDSSATRRRRASPHALNLAIRSCSLKELSVRHEVAEVDVHSVSPMLGAPWSGTISTIAERPPRRSVTPVGHSRTRSTDSTDTVTASPGSSALHDAARDWDAGARGAQLSPVKGSPIVEGRSFTIDTAVSNRGHGDDNDGDTAFWSPVSRQTVFYSAPSSACSGSSVGCSQSLEGHPLAQSHVYRFPKAASAGPCA